MRLKSVRLRVFEFLNYLAGFYEKYGTLRLHQMVQMERKFGHINYKSYFEQSP
jgi:hypothetical protein